MKYCRIIGLIVLACVMALAGIEFLTKPTLLTHKDIQTMAQRGVQGVPDLISVLRTSDSMKDKINRFIWPYLSINSPIQMADPNQATRNRVSAAYELSKMGPTAEPAIPILIDLLGDRSADVSMTAALALKNIGPKALPALRNAAQSTDSLVRNRAFTLPWSLYGAFGMNRRDRLLKLLKFLSPITTGSIPLGQTL